MLDVGCGDGALSQYLPSSCTYRGIDPVVAALGLGADPRFLTGTSEDLPFDDASFDYVIASEVLEHLPEQVAARTVTELARVSRGYVLVTVPNRESPRLVAAPCKDCQHIYNIYGHLRAYDESVLAAQFSPLKAIKLEPFGPRTLATSERYLRARQEWAGYYADSSTSVCPECGGVGTMPSQKGIRAYMVMAMRRLTEFEKRHAWLLGLFHRA